MCVAKQSLAAEATFGDLKILAAAPQQPPSLPLPLSLALPLSVAPLGSPSDSVFDILKNRTQLEN